MFENLQYISNPLRRCGGCGQMDGLGQQIRLGRQRVVYLGPVLTLRKGIPVIIEDQYGYKYQKAKP